MRSVVSRVRVCLKISSSSPSSLSSNASTSGKYWSTMKSMSA